MTQRLISVVAMSVIRFCQLHRLVLELAASRRESIKRRWWLRYLSAFLNLFVKGLFGLLIENLLLFTRAYDLLNDLHCLSS